uniref:Uncharacterized protein n=1 Tax=Lepeophtheirus salmonis TaxID=72036 RepID=A0A0K2V089_LEPSM
MMIFCRYIIVSPCWTQSRIGDRHRSNSRKYDCFYPFSFLSCHS